MPKNTKKKLSLFWRTIRPLFYKHIVWSYTLITMVFCPYLRELFFDYYYLVLCYMYYPYLFLFIYSYFVSAPISKNYVELKEEDFPHPSVRAAIRLGAIRTIKQASVATRAFVLYFYTTKLYTKIFVVKLLYRRHVLPWFTL